MRALPIVFLVLTSCRDAPATSFVPVVTDVPEPHSEALGFEPLQALSTGDGARDVALGDLNRDGRLDMAVVGRTSVQVLWASGTRSYEVSTFPLPDEPWAVAIADLDADGWPEVIASRLYAARLTVFRGSPTGFQSSFELTTPPAPGDLALADVDADGHVDLVIGHGSDTVLTLMRGPTFTAEAIDGFSQAGTPIVADLDGDGSLDLAGASRRGISVRSQYAPGQFSPAITVPLTGYAGAIVAANLDGTGAVDLAVARFAGGVPALVLSGRLGVQVNDLGQAGTFRDVAAGDVDGDGRIDLLFADADQALAIALNDEHASFSRWLRVPTDAQEQQLAVGDLDGDGSLDVVVVDLNRAAVLWGRGGLPSASSTCAPRGSACETGLPCCTTGPCVSGQCL